MPSVLPAEGTEGEAGAVQREARVMVPDRSRGQRAHQEPRLRIPIQEVRQEQRPGDPALAHPGGEHRDPRFEEPGAYQGQPGHIRFLSDRRRDEGDRLPRLRDQVLQPPLRAAEPVPQLEPRGLSLRRDGRERFGKDVWQRPSRLDGQTKNRWKNEKRLRRSKTST